MLSGHFVKLNKLSAYVVIKVNLTNSIVIGQLEKMCYNSVIVL